MSLIIQTKKYVPLFRVAFIEDYLQVPDDKSNALYTQLPRTLANSDVDAVINTLKPFLSSIPYDIINETENYYQTATHLIFTMLGMNCRSEVRIAQGRIDTLVETKRFVYCFEFKLNGTAEEALAQIDSKEYLLPWKGSGKKLFKVGVVFDAKKRNISAWKTDGQKVEKNILRQNNFNAYLIRVGCKIACFKVKILECS